MGGRLKLFSPGAGGREVALELVAPGEVVGALGMADGAPRYASAAALENSELAAIEHRHLELLMDRHPELRTALSLAAADVARRLARRLEDAAFLGIEDRIEKALLDLAQRVGERIAGGTRIRLRQQDLADLLGLSRESVNKVLTSPAMRHRLELGRGSIVLVGR
jgi:CRP/FNR family cyclic AMP-dependent transcriptional regulator